MRKQRGSPNAAKSVSTDHPQGNLRIRRQVRQQQVASGSANPASPERGGARSAGGGMHAQNSRSEASSHPSPRSCEMLAAKRTAFRRTWRQTSVGVWGSGRLSLHPLAAASPVVRLYDIQGASPRKRACNMVSRRIRELQFMVPEFVERTGGSKWARALPGQKGRLSNVPIVPSAASRARRSAS